MLIFKMAASGDYNFLAIGHRLQCNICFLIVFHIRISFLMLFFALMYTLAHIILIFAQICQ